MYSNIHLPSCGAVEDYALLARVHPVSVLVDAIMTRRLRNGTRRLINGLLQVFHGRVETTFVFVPLNPAYALRHIPLPLSPLLLHRRHVHLEGEMPCSPFVVVWVPKNRNLVSRPASAVPLYHSACRLCVMFDQLVNWNTSLIPNLVSAAQHVKDSPDMSIMLRCLLLWREMLALSGMSVGLEMPIKPRSLGFGGNFLEFRSSDRVSDQVGCDTWPSACVPSIRSDDCGVVRGGYLVFLGLIILGILRTLASYLSVPS
jgi:hypothetical protein